MPLHRVFRFLNGVRPRLVILALVTTTPFIIGEVVDIQAAQRAAATRQTEAAETAARELSHRVGMVLSEARTLLGIMAALPEPDGQGGAACPVRLAPVVQETFWLRAAALIDEAGTVRCATGNAAGSIEPAGAFRQGAAAARQFTTSGITATAAGEPAVLVSSPIGEPTASAKAVVAVIGLDWLGGAAALDVRDGQALVALFGGDGRLAAAFPPLATADQRDLESAMKAGAGDAGRGTFTADAGEGNARVFAMLPLPLIDARIAVGMPLDAVAAAAAARARKAYVEMASVLALVLLLAWVGGEILLVRPIRQLLTTAEAITDGNFSARADVRTASTQFTRLTAAFNAMADRLEGLVARDALTGLANRRMFDRMLQSESRRSGRAGLPLTLAFLDVDYFKRFNDRYGHPAGDECLRRVAVEIQRFARRATDIAARYGGEEFALLLPGVGRADALRHCEALRAAIEAIGIPHAGSDKRVVTVCIGIASLESEESVDPADLIAAADAALYQAKDRGRNTVILGSRTPVAQARAA